MKKVTVMLALIGSVYVVNAQVGIGTPRPADASQLEIKATDKGVLIPRIALTSTAEFSPIQGAEIESLLVYNTNTTTGQNGVEPGFYFWVEKRIGANPVEAYWERIVDQTTLDEAIGSITSIEGDIAKVIELLTKVYPSNNLVDLAVSDDTLGGGLIYTPSQEANGENPAVAPKIEYVYYDGTNYRTKDITSDLVTLINGNESKTTILEYPTNAAKFYYIAEETISANGGIVPTTPFETDGTTLRPGVVFIDVPESVIQNIETILDGTTTILKPGATTEYYTVEEIIKLIASEVEGNVIYKNIGDDTDPNWVFQYFDGTQYVTINLADVLEALEAKTQIKRAVAVADRDDLIYEDSRTAPIQDDIKKGEIYYQYSAEGGAVDYINVTADILTSITNNEEIRNEINEIINNIIRQGGNVYFTETAIEAADNEGVEVPANSLFVLKEVGGVEVKTPIDISGTVFQVIADNSVAIKKMLGDKIVNNIVINTGNQENGKDIYRYKGTTDIEANTAVTSGVTIENFLDGMTQVSDIISIRLAKNGSYITSNITDLTISGAQVDFYIGTGSMYHALPGGTYQVVIEFTAQ